MQAAGLDSREQEENVVLEFRPESQQDMLVACLWSISEGEEGEADLYSFAAIIDEPPAEVSAAGHDRCIVPVKPEQVEAWLNPDAKNLPRSMQSWTIGTSLTTSTSWQHRERRIPIPCRRIAHFLHCAKGH